VAGGPPHRDALGAEVDPDGRLILNVRAAGAVGLTLPRSLLGRSR
jgi:hypothetical protein